MSTQLSAFYEAFADAVVEGRPRALGGFLDDPIAVENALVYRNTVFRGAADALATAYPAVVRLAGAAYFESVAVSYVTHAPPRARSLVGYGEDFPAFLSNVRGMEQAPYLVDAARLDRAWLEAHRARGAAALAAVDLSAVPAQRLADLKLRLHPSVRIVSLAWSVYEAWSANRTADGSERRAREVRQCSSAALFWRLDYEVEHRTLTEAEAAFFVSLRDGRSLGDAAETALAVSAEFNTSLVFAGAIEAGLFDASQPDIEAVREE